MNLHVILAQGSCQFSLYRPNFVICAAEESTVLHPLLRSDSFSKQIAFCEF